VQQAPVTLKRRAACEAVGLQGWKIPQIRPRRSILFITSQAAAAGASLSIPAVVHMHHWGHTHARALPLFRQRQQAVQRLLWAAQNNRIPAAIACRLTTAAASAQRLSTSQHDGGSSGTPGSSTRVRVLRQAFISVTKDEMHEAMSHFGKQSHGSSAATNWAALRKVLASLEIVYRTEYQRAGEELQCSIRAMNSCVIVPPGARVEKGTHGEPDDAVFASPDDARQLEQQFLQRFQALTAKCHFRPITARDSAMADVLNVDYLSQLFIQPSPESTDGALVEKLVDTSMEQDMRTVAVLHRGWGTQERKGAVVGPKLDFLQQVAARGLIRSFQSQGRALRSWAHKLSKKASEALQTTIVVAKERAREMRQNVLGGQLPSGTAREGDGPARGVGLEARQREAAVAEDRRQSVADDRRSRGGVHTWRLAHILAPPHGEERLREFEDEWPIHEPPGRSPLHISRVTVGDALGGDELVNVRKEGLLAMLTTTVKLAEPTFKEILVVSRPKPSVSRLSLAKKTIRQTLYNSRLRRWEFIEGVRKVGTLIAAAETLLMAPFPPPTPQFHAIESESSTHIRH